MRLRREHLTTGLAVGAAVIVTALATGLWSFGDRPEERAVAPNPPTTTDNPQGSEQAHGKAEALDPSSTATGSGIGGGLTGTSPCELSGPPASAGQVGKDAEGHNHRGPVLQETLTREESMALQAEQARARKVAERYPTVADAEAAGYHKSTVYVPCIGAHYTNTRYAVGFDIDNPSELLYDGTAPDARSSR